MSRPVTLFTGQWADLSLEALAQKVSAWGFDGLELACWGDHFEVDKALEDPSYLRDKWSELEKRNLDCFASDFSYRLIPIFRNGCLTDANDGSLTHI